MSPLYNLDVCARSSATSFRLCQKQSAHAVFCDRTHLDNAGNAIVYDSFNACRRVHSQATAGARHCTKCQTQWTFALWLIHGCGTKYVNWLRCEIDMFQAPRKHTEIGAIFGHEQKFVEF